jgi:hypothetical protein
LERETASERIGATPGGGMSGNISISKDRERERDGGPLEIRKGDREIELMHYEKEKARDDAYRGDRK